MAVGGLGSCGAGACSVIIPAGEMASGGGVELGDPERYCARLVKLDRFRLRVDDGDADVIGIGGTGTLMHDGEIILGGKATLFMVTVAGGGGGGGGGGGMGDAVCGSKTRFGAFC